MKTSRRSLVVIAATALVLAFGAAAQQPSRSRSNDGVRKMQHAHGSFDVKLTPQKPDSPEAEASKIARISLDKRFQGDLSASSRGEMLYNISDVKDSGGYVAMERVTGTLNGRSGSFVLQHIGTRSRGEQALTISVVPDSGTEQLQGLTGLMTIKIEADGKHFYDFEYELPSAR